MTRLAAALLSSLVLGLVTVAAVPAAAQEVATGAAGEMSAALESAFERLRAGAPEEAVAILEPFRQLPNPPAPLLALLGVAYLEAGRPGPAQEVLSPLAERDDADPAVLYNAGRAALAAGDTARGAAFLERSVQLAPGSPAARELGLLRGQDGRYQEAYVLLRPWLQTHPDDEEARLAAAFCAVRLERAPEAEELLSDLPQDQPRVRLLWGKLLLLKGDPYGAIATLKPLLEGAATPVDLDARRTLAEAYVTVGQGALAVELLEGLDSGNPSMALQLSQAQYQSGDLQEALATLEPFARPARSEDEARAAGLPPSLRAVLLLEHGRLLVAAGRHEDALPYLELVTELAPDTKQGWQSLGQALAAVGRTEDAQAALQRFRDITHSEVPPSMKEMQVEADLEDPTGRELRKAVQLLGQGRPEEALLLARREAELSPADVRPHLLESRVLLSMDRHADALEAVGRVLAMDPENADAHYQRGAVRMALTELEAAEADLRRALELAPDHTAAMNDLAVLLMERGAREEARALLERVLELRPKDSVATANLKRLSGE